jgi:hypothetical protein
MKRAAFFVVLLATILVATQAPRVVAQEKPSPYEYRVFLVDAREFSDKDDWKQVLEQEGGNAFHADATFKAYVLNHLAKEGWELVQVVQTTKDKPEIVHFYLRRHHVDGK